MEVLQKACNEYQHASKLATVLVVASTVVGADQPISSLYHNSPPFKARKTQRLHWRFVEHRTTVRGGACCPNHLVFQSASNIRKSYKGSEPDHADHYFGSCSLTEPSHLLAP